MRPTIVQRGDYHVPEISPTAQVQMQSLPELLALDPESNPMEIDSEVTSKGMCSIIHVWGKKLKWQNKSGAT